MAHLRSLMPLVRLARLAAARTVAAPHISVRRVRIHRTLRREPRRERRSRRRAAGWSQSRRRIEGRPCVAGELPEPWRRLG